MNCKIVFGLKALLTEVWGARRRGNEREGPSSSRAAIPHSLGSRTWPAIPHVPSPVLGSGDQRQLRPRLVMGNSQPRPKGRWGNRQVLLEGKRRVDEGPLT